MTLMVNTDTQTRVWPSLLRIDAKTSVTGTDVTVVADAGSTLMLDPGEQADVELPDDFDDPYLKPVKAKKGKDADAPAGQLASTLTSTPPS